MFQRHRHAGGVVFAIPAIAQQHEGQAGSTQVVLRFPVFRRKAERRDVGAQDAGIGEEPDARRLGGVDDGAVLGHAAAKFAGGNQKQLVGAAKCRLQRLGAVVIRLAHDDTAGGEILHAGWITDCGNDLRGGNFFQQGGDDKAAKLAGSSGNNDHGANSIWLTSGVGIYSTNILFVSTYLEVSVK